VTYLAFHGVFIVPPIAALALLLRGRGVLDRRGTAFLALIAAIALVYTTPWDNYLVWRGVWGYGADRVIGTIGHVPVEEYLFFVLQPLLTGLWLYLVLAREGPARAGDGAGEGSGVRRVAVVGAVLYLGIAVAGALLLLREETTYLGLILAWAGPVLAGQWAYAGAGIWARRRSWARGGSPSPPRTSGSPTRSPSGWGSGRSRSASPWGSRSGRSRWRRRSSSWRPTCWWCRGSSSSSTPRAAPAPPPSRARDGGAPVSRRGRDYDVIVVGAGHNGLVTAAYLAQAGYRVGRLRAARDRRRRGGHRGDRPGLPLRPGRERAHPDPADADRGGAGAGALRAGVPGAGPPLLRALPGRRLALHPPRRGAHLRAPGGKYPGRATPTGASWTTGAPSRGW
jgi:lycopene cyclase domain-containing protein